MKQNLLSIKSEELEKAKELLKKEGIGFEETGALYAYCVDEAQNRFFNEPLTDSKGLPLSREEAETFIQKYTDRLYDSDMLIDYDEAEDCMGEVISEENYEAQSRMEGDIFSQLILASTGIKVPISLDVCNYIVSAEVKEFSPLCCGDVQYVLYITEKEKQFTSVSLCTIQEGEEGSEAKELYNTLNPTEIKRFVEYLNSKVTINDNWQEIVGEA